MIRQIKFDKLEQWRKDQVEFILVDVREPVEHHAANIGGHLVPLSELKSGHYLFKSKLPVVVYCKRGIRSQIAIQRLKNLFPTTEFFNLEGGILHLLADHQ